MSRKAGSAVASRFGTCAAKALQCAGYAVLLRWHGRFAGAPRPRGDATRRTPQSGRQSTTNCRTTVKEAALQ